MGSKVDRFDVVGSLLNQFATMANKDDLDSNAKIALESSSFELSIADEIANISKALSKIAENRMLLEKITLWLFQEENTDLLTAIFYETDYFVDFAVKMLNSIIDSAHDAVNSEAAGVGAATGEDVENASAADPITMEKVQASVLDKPFVLDAILSSKDPSKYGTVPNKMISKSEKRRNSAPAEQVVMSPTARLSDTVTFFNKADSYTSQGSTGWLAFVLKMQEFFVDTLGFKIDGFARLKRARAIDSILHPSAVVVDGDGSPANNIVSDADRQISSGDINVNDRIAAYADAPLGAGSRARPDDINVNDRIAAYADAPLGAGSRARPDDINVNDRIAAYADAPLGAGSRARPDDINVNDRIAAYADAPLGAGSRARPDDINVNDRIAAYANVPPSVSKSTCSGDIGADTQDEIYAAATSSADSSIHPVDVGVDTRNEEYADAPSSVSKLKRPGGVVNAAKASVEPNRVAVIGRLASATPNVGDSAAAQVGYYLLYCSSRQDSSNFMAAQTYFAFAAGQSSTLGAENDALPSEGEFIAEISDRENSEDFEKGGDFLNLSSSSLAIDFSGYGGLLSPPKRDNSYERATGDNEYKSEEDSDDSYLHPV